MQKSTNIQEKKSAKVLSPVENLMLITPELLAHLVKGLPRTEKTPLERYILKRLGSLDAYGKITDQGKESEGQENQEEKEEQSDFSPNSDQSPSPAQLQKAINLYKHQQICLGSINNSHQEGTLEAEKEIMEKDGDKQKSSRNINLNKGILLDISKD